MGVAILLASLAMLAIPVAIGTGLPAVRAADSEVPCWGAYADYSAADGFHVVILVKGAGETVIDFGGRHRFDRPPQVRFEETAVCAGRGPSAPGTLPPPANTTGC